MDGRLPKGAGKEASKWLRRNYPVKYANKKWGAPEVVYTNEPAIVEQTLARMDTAFVGFDMEWEFSKQRGAPEIKTGLVQVCDGKISLLVHLAHMDGMDARLRDFIQDASKVKIGVNIANDGRKLVRDCYASSPKGFLDIAIAAKALDSATWTDTKSPSLQKLVAVYMGCYLLKDDSVRGGKWNMELSPPQKEYATSDVLSTFRVYERLVALFGADAVHAHITRTSVATEKEAKNAVRKAERLAAAAIAEEEAAAERKAKKKASYAAQKAKKAAAAIAAAEAEAAAAVEAEAASAVQAEAEVAVDETVPVVDEAPFAEDVQEPAPAPAPQVAVAEKASVIVKVAAPPKVTPAPVPPPALTKPAPFKDTFGNPGFRREQAYRLWHNNGHRRSVLSVSLEMSETNPFKEISVVWAIGGYLTMRGQTSPFDKLAFLQIVRDVESPAKQRMLDELYPLIRKVEAWVAYEAALPAYTAAKAVYDAQMAQIAAEKQALLNAKEAEEEAARVADEIAGFVPITNIQVEAYELFHLGWSVQAISNRMHSHLKTQWDALHVIWNICLCLRARRHLPFDKQKLLQAIKAVDSPDKQKMLADVGGFIAELALDM